LRQNYHLSESIMKNDLYFINEDYNLYPDIFTEETSAGHLVSQGIHLSVDRPLKYMSSTLPSTYSKDFYDLEALIVSPKVAHIFEKYEPNGVNITPIEIEFSDGIKLKYYRIDTSQTHDLIDYDKSEINFGDSKSGYIFNTIDLNNDKIINAAKKSDMLFFSIEGLKIIQYMVNKKIRDEILMIKSSAILSDHESYVGI